MQRNSINNFYKGKKNCSGVDKWKGQKEITINHQTYSFSTK